MNLTLTGTADACSPVATHAIGQEAVGTVAATLKALADGDDAAIRWVEVGAAADSLDIANAVVFRKELDKLGISATLGLAVPAAIGGWYAARKLRAA